MITSDLFDKKQLECGKKAKNDIFIQTRGSLLLQGLRGRRDKWLFPCRSGMQTKGKGCRLTAMWTFS